MSNREAIIFDFDGTLTQFRKIDNEIIETIFKGHKVMLFIDSFLWIINGLGIIGNSMLGLKIRLYLYALFSFKTTKRYINVLVRYEEMYIALSSNIKEETLNSLRKIKEKYKVVIISNNFFAKGIVVDGIKVDYAYKKKKLFKEERNKNDVAYIVGDNLFDDYMNSKNTPFIYVGNSFIVRFIIRLNPFKRNVVRIKKISDIEDVVL